MFSLFKLQCETPLLINKSKIKIYGLICLNSDANKSVFDWCKDGNVKKMDVLLRRGQSVNTKDDQVSVYLL